MSESVIWPSNPPCSDRTKKNHVYYFYRKPWRETERPQTTRKEQTTLQQRRFRQAAKNAKAKVAQTTFSCRLLLAYACLLILLPTCSAAFGCGGRCVSVVCGICVWQDPEDEKKAGSDLASDADAPPEESSSSQRGAEEAHAKSQPRVKRRKKFQSSKPAKQASSSSDDSEPLKPRNRSSHAGVLPVFLCLCVCLPASLPARLSVW